MEIIIRDEDDGELVAVTLPVALVFKMKRKNGSSDRFITKNAVIRIPSHYFDLSEPIDGVSLLLKADENT